MFSAYGAAGSLIVILLWIFYSAQILLFGAEFTKIYAQRYAAHITPSENAVAVTTEARAQQGMTPETERMPQTNVRTAETNAVANPKVLPMITSPLSLEIMPKQVVTEPPNIVFALAAACVGFIVGFFVKMNPSEKNSTVHPSRK